MKLKKVSARFKKFIVNWAGGIKMMDELVLKEVEKERSFLQLKWFVFVFIPNILSELCGH